MIRASPYVLSLLRHRACRNRNAQMRNLSVDSRDGDSRTEESKSIGRGSISPEISRGNYTEMARIVSKIMREKPRWEQILVSDFPSFNFADPLFFRELLLSQKNVLLSLWFFQWLCSNHDFTPDPISSSMLFEALLDAKAVRAAKMFLDSSGFSPEPASLEHYVQCLSEEGFIEEAIEVYFELKKLGIRLSIATCNSVLSGCLKSRKTDLLLEFYHEMMDAGAASDVNLDTVGYLIQAFCYSGQVTRGYELLKQVLKLGLDPGNVAYNKLVAGFCQTRDYACMSEVLHTMIARNHMPTIYTYQEILNGLCKKKKQREAYRVFNDLKDRGYSPDRVMYTTMIHGLCEMGWFGDARKLWFEMINKGMQPNKFTYNTMLHWYLKSGDFERARELYNEMCEKGYGETTVTCNTLISGFCSHRKSEEAFDVFKKMSETGITADAITYNSLIQGFSKEGKVGKGMNLLDELVALGLQPSASSYAALIRKSCQNRDFETAKRLWKDMIFKGIEPLPDTHEPFIAGFCEQGRAVEGMNWLMEMLENKIKPKETAFENLIKCLIQIERFDDCLLVFHMMLKMGYVIKEEGVCHSLVSRLGLNSSGSVGASLSDIIESGRHNY